MRSNILKRNTTMLESLKRFLRVYPLPIFVLLLTFVVYYFAFELFKKQSSTQTPISQEESMQITQDSEATNTQDSTQIAQIEPIESTETTQEVAQLPESQLPSLELPESKTIYLTTNVRSLNIRKTPDTNAAIVGKFIANATFIQLEEQNGWVLIGDSTTTNPVGWVLQRFTQEVKKEQDNKQEVAQLPESQLPSLEIPESKTIYLTTNVRSLNIRKTPDTNAAIVGKFIANATFIQLEEQNGWVLIGDSTTTNPVGWVLQRFTQEVKKEQDNKQEVAQNIESTMESKAESTSTNNTESQNTILYASKVPSLNIRENPSTEARIVGKLTPNDSVAIIAEDGIWVKIQDSNATGKNGWVVRRSLIPHN